MKKETCVWANVHFLLGFKHPNMLSLFGFAMFSLSPGGQIEA